MTEVIKTVERWLTAVVIGLNLCPFAQREYRSDKVRFKESAARDTEQLLKDLIVELSLLSRRDDIETTLLIVPNALSDFLTFNDFLGFADDLLLEMKLDGVYQIASFHPHYQFAGTTVDDVQNYTNRAPYPILHLLREDSVSRAIEHHPNTDKIPDDNIQLMRSLGVQHMQTLLAKCNTHESS